MRTHFFAYRFTNLHQRAKGALVSVICFVLLLMVLSSHLAATADCGLTKDDDIDTNRPSFMDSPLVVPRGSLQFENGMLYQHFQHGINYIDGSETEVRFGLTQKTEFQMFVPNWVLLHSAGSSTAAISTINPTLNVFQTTSSTTTSGVSDIGEAGFKRQFHPPIKNLNIALIAGVNIPTGRQFISGSGVQPVIRGPWTRPFCKNWQIGGMQSILVINSGRDVQWQNFWCLCRNFGARTTTFVEYAGFYTQQAAPSNIIHFGFVRKLNKNNQVDTHFGFGLDRTAPTAFVGVGYSFRFDQLPIVD